MGKFAKDGTAVATQNLVSPNALEIGASVDLKDLNERPEFSGGGGVTFGLEPGEHPVVIARVYATKKENVFSCFAVVITKDEKTKRIYLPNDLANEIWEARNDIPFPATVKVEMGKPSLWEGIDSRTGQPFRRASILHPVTSISPIEADQPDTK